jgi:hypothetical protein
MPAIDNCEPQVIRAMEKADWTVTHKNFGIRVGKEATVFADLRLINQENNISIIVVEIKYFPDTRTTLSEFHHALGQYIWYRNALMLKGLDLPLYLAVPAKIYDTFFQRATTQSVISDAKIKLIVIDMEREKILQWLP